MQCVRPVSQAARQAQAPLVAQRRDHHQGQEIREQDQESGQVNSQRSPIFIFIYLFIYLFKNLQN